jgi:hypothetical protein
MPISTKSEAARLSETLTDIFRSIRRHITEDSKHHSQRRDILHSRGVVRRLVINSRSSSSIGEIYSRLTCLENFGL